ncbi:hypothetical protein [Humisphaera borealis]|uniref:Uncharacterized protein n=1 Tax=Humisphaera borealis TaxID=2807512 RepID=A0A7M2WYJ3_9BACT|nr:hypothetical protein [Humisphaera borealis]QOV90292.1 hypothetical protein IPV69_02660 [Humisphaera borealis]
MHSRNLGLTLLLALAVPFAGGAGAAGPSQEDVFRSIQDSVGGNTDAPDLLPYVAGAVGLLLLVVIVSQRRKRVVTTKSLNHQGKLLREIVKSVPIRGREMKQLKIVAENTETDGPQPSPLTLLLCPSVMARTIQRQRMKVDRRALMSIARKAGLQVAKK